MRIIRWFFRRGKAADARTCRHCTATLEPCALCDGAWQGRACGCGIGLRCPACGPHWA